MGFFVGAYVARQGRLRWDWEMGEGGGCCGGWILRGMVVEGDGCCEGEP